MDDTVLEARDAQGGPPPSVLSSLSARFASSSTTASTTSTESTTTATSNSALSSTLAQTSAQSLAAGSTVSTQPSVAPSSNGLLVSTTLHSAPSSTSASGTGSTSSLPAGATSLAESNQATNAGSGMSTGALAAAVVVPVLIGLLILAVFALLWRRRRRGSGSGLPFLPAMKERNAGARNAGAAPIMMGTTNTAYYTGIGSSVDGEHGEFYGDERGGASLTEPPPPYKKRNLDGTRNVTIPISAGAGAATVPAVREPTGYRRDSPSPDSWATPRDESLLDVPGAYERSVASRAGTEQSITSTLYSDDASVHSARAARMSTGGANVLAPLGDQSSTRSQSTDPFEDPDSPVSSIAASETRSLNSRGVSPVSFGSRQQQ